MALYDLKLTFIFCGLAGLSGLLWYITVSMQCLPFDCKVFAGQGKGLPIFECSTRPNTELAIKV